MTGFIDFIKRQGVVGLAVGFMLGGAVSKLVAALVNDVVNPLLALAINTANLRDNALVIRDVRILWGDLLATAIDFVIIAAVVYIGFRVLKLGEPDAKA
ncbi:MAG: MscL family protein [Candidatus Yanofskybacteria bacterium]|nr:MscL family protein [Candidatus Yanofskybacteria bacterium]